MPKRLPENVRALRGNAGKRTSTSRPKAVVAAPEAPDWLAEEARAEWDRVTPELERMGLIARIDGAILAAYCCAWAVFVSVATVLDPTTTVDDPTHPGRPFGGRRKDPRWQIYRESAAMVRTLGRELGLTPPRVRR
jgi:P27 family predicted phage terminase small subunit